MISSSSPSMHDSNTAHNETRLELEPHLLGKDGRVHRRKLLGPLGQALVLDMILLPLDDQRLAHLINLTSNHPATKRSAAKLI